jgi:uncharacterized protein with FMN-binding domain
MRTSTIKAVAAFALTGVGSVFVLGFKTSDPAIDKGPQVNGTSGGSTAGSGSSATSRSTGSNGSTGSTGSATSRYADGTWTGAAVSEPWGPFQVEVVISGGAITDVTVAEAPSDRHSSRINGQAVPLLTESVLASQGTSVDMVSGATWTSDSYATSLQSALDAASQARS